MYFSTCVIHSNTAYRNTRKPRAVAAHCTGVKAKLPSVVFKDPPCSPHPPISCLSAFCRSQHLPSCCHLTLLTDWSLCLESTFLALAKTVSSSVGTPKKSLLQRDPPDHPISPSTHSTPFIPCRTPAITGNYFICLQFILCIYHETNNHKHSAHLP